MFALLYYIDSVYQPTTECELNRVFARSFARSHISYSSMTKQLYWLLTSIYINEQKLCSIFLPVGVKSFVRSHSFLCYIYRPSTTNRMPFILCSMKSFFFISFVMLNRAHHHICMYYNTINERRLDVVNIEKLLFFNTLYRDFVRFVNTNKLNEKKQQQRRSNL